MYSETNQLKLIVTEHCLEQYLKRIRGKNDFKSDIEKQQICLLIQKNISRARSVHIPRWAETVSLINNNFEPAEYKFYSGIIYVIAKNVVKTCYPYSYKKVEFIDE